jgi:hypothetical protein
MPVEPFLGICGMIGVASTMPVEPFLGICGMIAFSGYDGFLYSIGFWAACGRWNRSTPRRASSVSLQWGLVE